MNSVNTVLYCIKQLELSKQTYLHYLLQSMCTLVYGGVGHVVAFSVLKHKRQVALHLINSLIIPILHLFPLTNSMDWFGLFRLQNVSEKASVTSLPDLV